MLKEFKSKKNNIFKIRYLCDCDAKDLLELYNALVDERAYTVATKKFNLKQEKNYIESCLRDVEDCNAIFLVAEVDEKVIGVVSIKKGGLLKEHIGDLGIIIAKDYRGEGLGSVLIDLCIKEAKSFFKIKMVSLGVFKDNNSAIMLYKKIGFIKIGEIKKGLKHFNRYKDEILMIKNL